MVLADTQQEGVCGDENHSWGEGFSHGPVEAMLEIGDQTVVREQGTAIMV